MQNDEIQIPRSVDPNLDSAFRIHHSSFPRSHRLSGKLAFAAVYDARRKATRGPLAMYCLPNQLGHHRLGLSVSRRVGTAPTRNRIKRLLRESFRLNRSQMASGYDLIIVVRPHAPMQLVDYQNLLAELMIRIQKHWS
jgi:ribonuclease P protein component